MWKHSILAGALIASLLSSPCVDEPPDPCRFTVYDSSDVSVQNVIVVDRVLVGWIVVQVLMIRELHWLDGLYFGIGIGLAQIALAFRALSCATLR